MRTRMPLLSHLKTSREQMFIASFFGVRKHAHIDRPEPHVLPAQDPNLDCCQAKLQDVSIHGVEPEIVQRQKLMQRNRRSLGINRAAIDMSLERDQSSAQVDKEATSKSSAQVDSLLHSLLHQSPPRQTAGEHFCCFFLFFRLRADN